jgi:serine/threonine protein kinase
MVLERQIVGLPEPQKQELRRVLEDEELKIQKEARKKLCPGDFESLAVIGRGAFGEVRLVRRKGKKEDPATGQIFALKGMKKEMMVLKNQVHHVKAERDALAQADTANQWLTVLHCSFFDETHLYMAMEYMPGGDLMSLLIKEDTFSESVTRFFMAEAAQAISSVHALGYIHRDIKPDNMLLDHRGHLKLTDLGLCKKVGEASKEEEPEAVLEMLRRQTLEDREIPGGDFDKFNHDVPTGAFGVAVSKHRSSDDAMAMSIDDTPGMRRDARTRREVRALVSARIKCLLFHFFNSCVFPFCRWHIQRWGLQTTLLRKYWQRRMERPGIAILRLLTGGH